MATTTTNYGLVKPAGTENYNVGVFNANMDALDAALEAVDNKIAAIVATNIGFKTNYGAFGAPYGTPRFVVSHDGKRVDIEGAFKRSGGGSAAIGANVTVPIADVPSGFRPNPAVDKQWTVPCTVAGTNRTANIHYDATGFTLDVVFPTAVTLAVGDFISLEGIGWWL